MDESGIDKHLVREHGRAARGVKVQAVKSGRKFQRTNVVAARCKDDLGNIRHMEPLVFKNTANAEFIVEWFKTRLVKALPRGSSIIMDNATHHPKKRLANLAKRHGMKLLFLPPYSPDLNPIEKDWANMKKSLVDIMKMPEVETLDDGIHWYFASKADNNTY